VKRNTTALKVYICNVATQPGETDGFGVIEHVRALQDHIGPGLFDYVIYNSNLESEKLIKPEWNVTAIKLDESATNRFPKLHFVPADVVRDDNPLRHDPAKLATAVMELYETAGGKNSTTNRVRENRNGTAASGAEDRGSLTKAL
jgi:2-phospho-L-lactate transferase/gluconeogenesis factor (CofD/UPF0052 family)